MPNRTFLQARSEILDTLQANQWTLSDRHLKVPHATSPNGRVRLWFKAQAVYSSHAHDGRHDFKFARSTFGTDIRQVTPVAFVTAIGQRYPEARVLLPVIAAPGTTTTAVDWKERVVARRPTPPRPTFKSTALKPKYFPFGSPRQEYACGPAGHARAEHDLVYLNERELRALLDEYQLPYDARDTLRQLQALVLAALDESIPCHAVPHAHDPRQQSLPMPHGRKTVTGPHLAVYHDRVVTVDDFRRACQRVNDNLGHGTGHVITPSGEVFEISATRRSAVRLHDAAADQVRQAAGFTAPTPATPAPRTESREHVRAQDLYQPDPPHWIRDQVGARIQIIFYYGPDAYTVQTAALDPQHLRASDDQISASMRRQLAAHLNGKPSHLVELAPGHYQLPGVI
jgi:hypothetical protein